MRTVLRLGGLAIAIALAFAAGRVSSHSHQAFRELQPPGGGADAGPPFSLPPWATQGFRDGETCRDVFADPG